MELFGADTIVFDKTGTLTSACPQVTQIVPLGDCSRDTNSDRISYTRATRGGTTHHYAYRNSDEQYYECRRYPFCQPLRAIGRNGRF